MLIQINDPVTKKSLTLQAASEIFEGSVCWRILLSPNNDVLITQRSGQWKIIGEQSIEPELLDEIGKALHPMAMIQHLTRKRQDMR